MIRYTAAMALLLVSLLSGCVLLYGGDASEDAYYYPYIYNADWDCYNYGYTDEWEFWAETNINDVYYILVEVVDLINGNNLHISFRNYDSIYGYYYHVEDFSLPQCGIPVDVEFTVYDYDGYWEKYTIYW